MTPPDPDAISLVIPVFNERESLAPLLAEIDAATKSLPQRVEIWFIDDGSQDGSWKAIRELAAIDPRVRGVRLRTNFGKTATLAAGFARATGAVVLTLDADLQDDPAEIPRFLQAIQAGADVVSGWKKIRYDPWHKVFPSRIFNRMVSAVSGVSLHDHNCGFKAYRADVVRELKLYGEFHRFVPVLAAGQGFRVEELVIHHRPRQFGQSKFGARRFLKGFLDLLTVRMLTAFGHRPLHLFGTLALLLGFGGAAGLVAFSLLSLTSLPVGVVILGGVVSVVALLAGVQAFFTGLLAEFTLARTADDPPYRIAETFPES